MDIKSIELEPLDIKTETVVVRFNRTIAGWIARDQWGNYSKECDTQEEALGNWVSVHAVDLGLDLRIEGI